MMFPILNAASLSGFLLQLCGGKVSEGVFVGAFLSMSSTAVVKLYLESVLCVDVLAVLYLSTGPIMNIVCNGEVFSLGHRY